VAEGETATLTRTRTLILILPPTQMSLRAEQTAMAVGSMGQALIIALRQCSGAAQ